MGIFLNKMECFKYFLLNSPQKGWYERFLTLIYLKLFISPLTILGHPSLCWVTFTINTDSFNVFFSCVFFHEKYVKTYFYPFDVLLV